MADISIVVDTNQIAVVAQRYHNVLDMAIRKSAYDIEANAKQRIQGGSKSGRLYKLRNPNRRHQASAPGESPATDLGTLVNSIQTVPGPAGSLHAEVRVSALYGVYLEFGAPKAKIAARPYMTPAVEAVKPKLIAVVRHLAGLP